MPMSQSRISENSKMSAQDTDSTVGRATGVPVEMNTNGIESTFPSTSTMRSSSVQSMRRPRILQRRQNFVKESTIQKAARYAENMKKLRSADVSIAHLKILVCSWNVGNAPPDSNFHPWIPENGGDYDLIAVAVQECSFKSKAPTMSRNKSRSGKQAFDIDEDDDDDSLDECDEHVNFQETPQLARKNRFSNSVEDTTVESDPTNDLHASTTKKNLEYSNRIGSTSPETQEFSSQYKDDCPIQADQIKEYKTKGSEGKMLQMDDNHMVSREALIASNVPELHRRLEHIAMGPKSVGMVPGAIAGSGCRIFSMIEEYLNVIPWKPDTFAAALRAASSFISCNGEHVEEIGVFSSILKRGASALNGRGMFRKSSAPAIKNSIRRQGSSNQVNHIDEPDITQMSTVQVVRTKSGEASPNFSESRGFDNQIEVVLESNDEATDNLSTTSAKSLVESIQCYSLADNTDTIIGESTNSEIELSFEDRTSCFSSRQNSSCGFAGHTSPHVPYSQASMYSRRSDASSRTSRRRHNSSAADRSTASLNFATDIVDYDSASSEDSDKGDQQNEWVLVDKIMLGENVGVLMDIGLMVLVRRKHAHAVTRIQHDGEATGIMNVVTNKGGVAISFYLYGTPLCFVGSHLAAHMQELARRNADVETILEGVRLGQVALPFDAQFSHVFWAGDLNYRIDRGLLTDRQNKEQMERLNIPSVEVLMAKGLVGNNAKPASVAISKSSIQSSGSPQLSDASREEGKTAASTNSQNASQKTTFAAVAAASHWRSNALKKSRSVGASLTLQKRTAKSRRQQQWLLVKCLIEESNFAELLAADQLRWCMRTNCIFAGFIEGKINFPPTFKVERKAGYQYKTQRIPSYCDRILYRSHPRLARHLHCQNVSAYESITTSDHKPVSSSFFLSCRPPPRLALRAQTSAPIIVFSQLKCSGVISADSNGLSDPYIRFFADPPGLLHPSNAAGSVGVLGAGTSAQGHDADKIGGDWWQDSTRIIMPNRSTTVSNASHGDSSNSFNTNSMVSKMLNVDDTSAICGIDKESPESDDTSDNAQHYNAILDDYTYYHPSMAPTTAVKRYTLDPVWDCRTEVPLLRLNIGNPIQLARCHLFFLVMDWDAAVSDDVLGCATLSCEAFALGEQMSHDFEIPIIINGRTFGTVSGTIEVIWPDDSRYGSLQDRNVLFPKAFQLPNCMPNCCSLQ